MNNELKCRCIHFDGVCHNCGVKAIEPAKCCEKATNSKPVCDKCIEESEGYMSQYDDFPTRNNNPQDNVPVKTKTLSECKDEIARRYGASGWEGISLDFFFEIAGRKIDYDGIYQLAYEMYASPLKDRIAELEALNKEYREALERVSLVHKNRKTTDNFYLMCKAIEIAQQALNPKPLTDG